MKLDPYLTPYTKINPNRIKDLNIGSKTIKLLKEKIGGKFPHTGFGNDFLGMTLKAQETKSKSTMRLHET